MTTFTRVAAAARAHHRVICLEELHDLGLSYGAVRHLIHTGRLWRVFEGVFALEGPLAPQGQALAAVYRCRPYCAASRLTGAFLSDYVDRAPAIPQVTVEGVSGARGPEGIDLSHSKTLTRADIVYREGIPTTAPARTIIDCAGILAPEPLKALVRGAEHHGLDLRTLDRPGIPRNLRQLLDRYVVGSGLTANELEARFYEICAAAGVPMPEVQRRISGRVDFAWPEHRPIVETDGRGTHDTFIAFTDDRVRDRAHVLAGYTTLRFTWAEVERSPETVAADLRAYFSRR